MGYVKLEVERFSDEEVRRILDILPQPSLVKVSIRLPKDISQTLEEKLREENKGIEIKADELSRLLEGHSYAIEGATKEQLFQLYKRTADLLSAEGIKFSYFEDGYTEVHLSPTHLSIEAETELDYLIELRKYFKNVKIKTKAKIVSNEYESYNFSD